MICGWFGANKMLGAQMILENLNGYMLGNTGHVAMRGDQWLDTNAPVYVCNNLDTAKRILFNSHQCGGIATPVWTTIYRVYARNLPVDKIDGNLIYTTCPTKIFVDAPVFYCAPRRITESQLMANAQRIRADFARLVNDTNHPKER